MNNDSHYQHLNYRVQIEENNKFKLEELRENNAHALNMRIKEYAQEIEKLKFALETAKIDANKEMYLKALEGINTLAQAVLVKSQSLLSYVTTVQGRAKRDETVIAKNPSEAVILSIYRVQESDNQAIMKLANTLDKAWDHLATFYGGVLPPKLQECRDYYEAEKEKAKDY